MSDKYKERAKVFKALCDERRLKILELLQDGEKCACVLIESLNMPQSSLSYHMGILCDSGIVEGREEGKWTYYSISREGSERAVEILREITTLPS
ncbi:MAG: ArsR/SmtB family transcription factor [Candidatus Ornithospirochaeta sp.]